MGRALLRLHRRISLAAGLLWLVQAGSGLVMVFHWELGDAQVAGAHRATDVDALQRRLAQLAPQGGGRRIVSVWATAGAADRYDITVADGARRLAVRTNGAADVLRVRDKARPDLLDELVRLHQSLLLGDAGRCVVGVSGLLLLSNVALGLKLAWPRRGGWGRALLLAPAPARPPTPRLFAWHRAAGLWLAAPAVVLVSAGALLAYDDPLRDLFGAQPPELPAVRPQAEPVPFAAAVRTAQAAMPGSRLTAVRMPLATDATYRIRLLAPGEMRRAYGVSTVFVDANTGRIRAVSAAGDGPVGRRVMDALYAVHTGEAAGLAGRLLNLVLAAWMLAMIGLGGWLWLRRRPAATASNRQSGTMPRARQATAPQDG